MKLSPILTDKTTFFVFDSCFIITFPSLVAYKSVIVFGNSTFQWNLDLETAKLHENQLFDFWFTRNTKKTTSFLSISLVFYKTWNKCQFFQIKWTIFRISLGYCLSRYSQVIVLIHLSRKSQNEKFLEFFSAFRRSYQNEKMLTFFRFLNFASLIDSCQKGLKWKYLYGLCIFGHFFCSCEDGELRYEWKSDEA